MLNFYKSSYNYGLICELLALIFLTLKLYRIISWRYKTNVGEIDIIASKKNTIIFIEVKARKDKTLLHYSLTTKQQQRILKASNLFIKYNRKWHKKSLRYDLIVINKIFNFTHIKNAWNCSDKINRNIKNQ